MGHELVRKFLKTELKFHPYKIMSVQQLNETNYDNRVEFTVQMLQLFEENKDVLIFMSDEAHFYLSVRGC